MCKCCKEIKFWKEHKPDENKFKEKIFTKLSIYTWRKEQKAIKGKQISTVTSKTFDLNYCPMCGRKLTK